MLPFRDTLQAMGLIRHTLKHHRPLLQSISLAPRTDKPGACKKPQVLFQVCC